MLNFASASRLRRTLPNLAFATRRVAFYLLAAALLMNLILAGGGGLNTGG